MAISYVGAGSNVSGNAASAASVVVPLVATQLLKDLLIVIVSSSSPTINIICPTAGWTTQITQYHTSGGLAIFTKISTGPSETAPTITRAGATDGIRAFMIAYRGAGGIDTISSRNNSGSASLGWTHSAQLLTTYPSEPVVYLFQNGPTATGSGHTGYASLAANSGTTVVGALVSTAAALPGIYVLQETLATPSLSSATRRAEMLPNTSYTNWLSFTISIAPASIVIPSSSIELYSSLAYNFPLELSFNAPPIPAGRIQSNDSIGITFPLEIDIDILPNTTPIELFNDTIVLSYPVELSVEQKLIDFTGKAETYSPISTSFPVELSVPVSAVLLPLSNDLEAVSYPVELSVPVSSVLQPSSNDLEAVAYPVELSVEQKLIDFTGKAETYSPISTSFPVELSVPVSAVLLPLSNDLEAVSYPVELSIIHNLINPRVNSIGFDNGSIFLNGTTGIDITEPAGSLYAIGNEFTAELWVRFNDLQNPVGLLAKRATTNLSLSEWITLSITSQGFIKLEVSSTNLASGWDLTLIGTQSVGKGIWYHIAAVKSGNTWNIYLNGKQYAFGTASGTVRSTFGTLSLGAYATDETYPLNGYIGGLRLVRDLALYTSEFIPPNYAFTNTQTANQDANPSLAITSGTVLVINPKYVNTTVSDDSGNSAVVTNVYQINHLSPLQLNLSTKFNNLFKTQSITSPFVANISGIGGVTTAASTVTELWI